MPNPSQRDLDNAVQAYKDARGRADGALDDALENLELARLTGQTRDDELFIRASKAALYASAQHNEAAQLATKVLYEISQLDPTLVPSGALGK